MSKSVYFILLVVVETGHAPSLRLSLFLYRTQKKRANHFIYWFTRFFSVETQNFVTLRVKFFIFLCFIYCHKFSKSKYLSIIMVLQYQ
jgi:hypothetical protein